MRNTREMISPIAPSTIKIRPMSGTFTRAEDQLTAYRRIAPITMLPPIVTGKPPNLGAALPRLAAVRHPKAVRVSAAPEPKLSTTA
jgi:hypothetical protein